VLFYTEDILLGIDPKALLEKVIFLGAAKWWVPLQKCDRTTSEMRDSSPQDRSGDSQ
jgi:hypothetical protein